MRASRRLTRAAAAVTLAGAVALTAAVSRGAARASSPAAQSSEAQLGFDGSNFFVVWNDFRTKSVVSEVYGNRVTESGGVLDGGGFRILAFPSAEGEQGSAHAAFDGTNHLVFSNHGARRVSPDGEILDRDVLPISLNPNVRPTMESALFGTSSYLLTWSDDSQTVDGRLDLRGARMRRAGTYLDSGAITISSAVGHQKDSSVAFDGTHFLVAWADYRAPTFLGDIYVSRVTQAGVVLDPNGIPITFSPPTSNGSPSVAFDGTNYLVVWESSGDIYGARVSLDGIVLDPGGFRISPEAGSDIYPSLAFDGTNFLVAWERRSATNIMGSRVSRTRQVLDPAGIEISTAPGYQFIPHVAFGSDVYLVVWSDGRADQPHSQAYGARVTPSGTVLDPEGLGISTGPEVPARYRPPTPPPPKMRRCVVPRVIGMRLAKAKARIRRARCTVGRVRRRTSTRPPGRVISQTPRAGTRLADKGRVSLVVSVRRSGK